MTTELDWENLSVVGKGGSSTVYKAVLKSSGRFIAVKQIEIDGLSKDQINGIKGEIETMKCLSHHNILSYLGTQQSPHRVFICLEYADRGSLRQFYQKQGPLSESQISYCLASILSGLNYLHSNGIAHRDIKCANCLLCSDGSVKLADFGASKKFESESIVSGLKGTPHWMAPEVIKGTQMTTGWIKSDVWSLGCTVVEMATAKVPYAEYENPMTAMYKIASGEIPSLKQIRNEQGEQVAPAQLLTSFLHTCCAVDPVARPDVHQLLEHPLVSKSMELLSSSITMREEDAPQTPSKSHRQRQGSVQALFADPEDHRSDQKDDTVDEVHLINSPPPVSTTVPTSHPSQLAALTGDNTIDDDISGRAQTTTSSVEDGMGMGMGATRSRGASMASLQSEDDTTTVVATAAAAPAAIKSAPDRAEQVEDEFDNDYGDEEYYDDDEDFAEEVAAEPSEDTHRDLPKDVSTRHSDSGSGSGSGGDGSSSSSSSVDGYKDNVLAPPAGVAELIEEDYDDDCVTLPKTVEGREAAPIAVADSAATTSKPSMTLSLQRVPSGKDLNRSTNSLNRSGISNNAPSRSNSRSRSRRNISINVGRSSGGLGEGEEDSSPIDNLGDLPTPCMYAAQEQSFYQLNDRLDQLRIHRQESNDDSIDQIGQIRQTSVDRKEQWQRDSSHDMQALPSRDGADHEVVSSRAATAVAATAGSVLIETMHVEQKEEEGEGKHRICLLADNEDDEANEQSTTEKLLTALPTNSSTAVTCKSSIDIDSETATSHTPITHGSDAAKKLIPSYDRANETYMAMMEKYSPRGEIAVETASIEEEQQQQLGQDSIQGSEQKTSLPASTTLINSDSHGQTSTNKHDSLVLRSGAKSSVVVTGSVLEDKQHQISKKHCIADELNKMYIRNPKTPTALSSVNSKGHSSIISRNGGCGGGGGIGGAGGGPLSAVDRGSRPYAPLSGEKLRLHSFTDPKSSSSSSSVEGNNKGDPADVLDRLSQSGAAAVRKYAAQELQNDGHSNRSSDKPKKYYSKLSSLSPPYRQQKTGAGSGRSVLAPHSVAAAAVKPTKRSRAHVLATSPNQHSAMAAAVAAGNTTQPSAATIETGVRSQSAGVTMELRHKLPPMDASVPPIVEGRGHPQLSSSATTSNANGKSKKQRQQLDSFQDAEPQGLSTSRYIHSAPAVARSVSLPPITQPAQQQQQQQPEQSSAEHAITTANTSTNTNATLNLSTRNRHRGGTGTNGVKSPVPRSKQPRLKR